MRTSLCFEDALRHLKAGRRIYRVAWTTCGSTVREWLTYERGQHLIDGIHLWAMGRPYAIPWSPVQADLLAEDWRIFPAPRKPHA